MRPAPSAWLKALLERLADTLGDDAIGDLDEEFAEQKRQSQSVLRSEAWYVREGLSLLGTFLLDRATSHFRASARALESEPGVDMMSSMRRDFSHAVRTLLRDAGTSTAVVITLAIAVGAITAIFSLAYAAFLKPLPYPDADRLVRVYTGFNEDPSAKLPVSPLDWVNLDRIETIIEESAVWSVGDFVHMTEAEQPLRLSAPRASASLFRMLGADMALGRFFTAEEEVPGQDDAVVLSHGLWETAFGADRGVLDRRVELDGRSYRVVGVAPERGVLPRDADVWRPLALGPEWYEDGRWGWQFLNAIARLTPGTDLGTATRHLNERLAEITDRAERIGQTRIVRSLYAERSAAGGPAILILLSAVALLLVMACANVMNVMLAKAESRVREFGLRRALGAGAGPLTRLIVFETLVLALAGGLGGVALASGAIRVLARNEVETLVALGPVSIDLPVLGFALLVTVVTAGVFGAAPLFTALHTEPQAILKDNATRTGTSSRRMSRFRGGLVVVQMALALTLLVAVGMSARAFQRLLAKDPGFDPRNVLTASIELPAGTAEAESSVFYETLQERLATLPGVEAAGITNFLPLQGIGWSASIELIDPDPQVTDPDPGANMRPISPGYFDAVGIPLREGRTFTAADGPDQAPVVIVDETVARLFWPSGSPLGRSVQVGGLSRVPATIVGVVGNVPDENLGLAGSGNVYFPLTQSPQRSVIVALRSMSDPTALAPALRQAIRELDPRIPVTEVVTFEDRVRVSLTGPRVGLLLLIAFGVAAALLAAVGTYGVLAYTVSRRTGEIGTRMALGAAPALVLRDVVGQAMRLWLLGAVGGILGSIATASLLARFVLGVDSADIAAYAYALAGLGTIALVSATIPARRATRIDPVQALRAE
jgi:putative ABC transport system permease protein